MITLSTIEANVVLYALNDGALQAFSDGRDDSGKAYRRLRDAIKEKLKEAIENDATVQK